MLIQIPFIIYIMFKTCAVYLQICKVNGTFITSSATDYLHDFSIYDKKL